MKYTTKGRIQLFRGSTLVSSHVLAEEAYERAYAHAVANGPGLYTVRYPDRELDLSTLSRVVYDTDVTRPSAPVLGAIAVLSASSLRVIWTGSTDTGGSGLVGYRVKRSSTSGGTYTQVGSDLSTASLAFDDTGLTAGTTYYYRVFAFDGAGNESLASNTGFGTTTSASVNTPYASPYALEMFFPRAAGTGSPAIPSTHRIFRQYPGLEYNIRASVRGGSYPYTFVLTNAPSGMTVNSRTGEITWTNPTSNATPTLTCTDSVGTVVSGTWTITVSTSGWYFVDGDYGGTSTGSITQPFKTLTDLCIGTNGVPTGMVVIRESTSPYTVTNYPPGTGDWKDTADDLGSLYINAPGNSVPSVSCAETWLAYPGESPVIDLQSLYFLRTNRPYFDGLTIRNGLEYSLKTSGGSSYAVLRRNRFEGLRPGSTSNRNQGFNFAISEGIGYYYTIQDNDFSDFVGAQALGSFYHCDDMLIEDNYTHDGGTQLPSNPFATPLGIKQGCSRATVRNNRFSIPSGAVYVEMYNQSGGDSMDFSYNKIIAGAAQVAFRFTDYSYNGARVFRNTIRGNVNFGSGLNHVNSLFDRNVVEGALSNTSAMAQGSNLTGASGIVDSSGDLTSTYASSLGTYGAQIP